MVGREGWWLVVRVGSWSCRSVVGRGDPSLHTCMLCNVNNVFPIYFVIVMPPSHSPHNTCCVMLIRSYVWCDCGTVILPPTCMLCREDVRERMRDKREGDRDGENVCDRECETKERM